MFYYIKFIFYEFGLFLSFKISGFDIIFFEKLYI